MTTARSTCRHHAAPRRQVRTMLGRCLLATVAALLFYSPLAWGQTTLWQGHANGKTLYLMGSIHVLQKEHYPLPETMEKAFQESDLIVFEIDQQEMESPASQEIIRKKGMYPAGQTLQQEVAPATFKALLDHLTALKLPPAVFQPMKPAYSALVITMMEFQRLGFEPRYGLDQYFADKARQQGKKTAALESAEFQINLFFDLSGDEQEKFLVQTLLELDTFASQSDKMSQAWRQGKSKELQELLTTSFQDFPGLYDRLIVHRNKTWLPLIEEYATEHDTVLVVVGAGHLVGPDSMISLLEERGYTFRQL